MKSIKEVLVHKCCTRFGTIVMFSDNVLAYIDGNIATDIKNNK